MAEEKICPLISNPESLFGCQKNGCMWFHQSEGMARGQGTCILNFVSFELGQLNKNLQFISQKMPGSGFVLGKKV